MNRQTPIDTAGPGPEPAPPGARASSIAVLLAALVFVTLAPAILFSAVLLQRNNDAQEAVVRNLVVSNARSIVQAVERELLAKITTLRVLAATQPLRSGDLAAFHATLVETLEGSGANMFLIGEDMETLLSTRAPFGVPQTITNDPEAARRAFETGEIQISDVVFGAVSRIWVYNILLPVSLPDGSTVILAMNQAAPDLAASLLADKMPDGWHVVLVDSKGDVLAASPDAAVPGEHFVLYDQVESLPGDGWVSAVVDGLDSRIVVQNSLLTGWSVITWAPSFVVSRPLLDAVLWLGIGGLGLAIVVIAATYWVILQIGRSVRGLAAQARALGQGEPVTATPYRVTELAEVSASLADAADKRAASENEIRLLMREVAHRSKNQLSVISAMAKQTARGTESIEAFLDAFQKRVLGLARSTDLLLAHGVAGVSMRDMAEAHLQPFQPDDAARVSVSGPAQRLNAQAAQILGMAMHEMATNAAKYGAFAGEDGRLSVRWSRHDGVLTLVWRETVSQPPATPRRRGFGTTVIENMVSSALAAGVERILHGNGIEWRFEIPLDRLRPEEAPPGGDDPAMLQF